MIIEVTYTQFNVDVPQEVVRVYEVLPFNLPDGILASIFTAKGQLLGASASGVAIAVPAPTQDNQVPLSDQSQTSGIRWGTPTVSVSVPDNFMVNSGFDFAQRQTPGTDTTITNEKYGPDGWICTRANAELQYSRQDGSSESGLVSRYFGRFKKITNAGKFMVYQPMEFVNTIPLRGQGVIAQVKMKASASKTIRMAIIELQAAGTADTLPAAVVSAWNVDSTDPTLGANLAVVGSVQGCSVTTAWQNFSVTGTVPSNSKNLILAIWSDADFAANDTLSLAEAGLYLGATTRGWTPRPPVQEINLIRRYYWKTFPLDIAPVQNAGNTYDHIRWMCVTAGATTSRSPTFYFPVEMFKTPTMTTYNPAGANAEVRDSVAAADCSVTAAANPLPTGFQLSCTGNAGGVAGNPHIVHVSADAGFR